jgi:beta-lactamase regulating signal transducer with metallopeptidase domain
MISPSLAEVANHVWQSTLFAAAIGVVTLFFQRNRASIRHALWLVASLKFLVPFALLAALGAGIQASVAWHFGVHDDRGSTASSSPMSPLISTLHDIAAPLTSPDSAFAPVAVAQHHGGLAAVLVGVWILGSTALALLWLMRWHRVQRMLRDSRAMDLPFPIPVRVSEALIEPGIVGILHPVLLMPAGIERRLTPAQLRAVLAHEQCHIQRRDNLSAALHMLVEVGFWFHPLVWWLGARLIAEREQACDEHVMRVGHEPNTYAEAILNMCQHYLEARLPIMAGISGASLRKRVETIMKNPPVFALTGPKKLLLAALGCAVVATPVVSGIVDSPPARAAAAHSRSTEGELLLLAAAMGNVAEMRSLLDQGADVNYENDHGITALTQAAQAGRTEVVQELLARGAQVDHPRAPGDTALMLAAMGGYASTVQALLETGADANLKAGAGGMTALTLAARSGSEQTVRLLLDAHAEVNSEMMLGETPLLIASRTGDARTVELLLQHGADVHHKSKIGEGALSLAAQSRNVAVVRVLLANGANPGE